MEKIHHELLHDLGKIIIGFTPISGFLDMCRFIKKWYIGETTNLTMNSFGKPKKDDMVEL